MASSTASSSTTRGVVPASPAVAMMLTSRHRLVAESGRDSSMRTVSPTCASLASPWALNLLVKRMTRLYSGCRVSRSTETTIGLSILSLTTRPTLVLRLPCTSVAPAMPGLLRARPHELALVANREDPGDRPAAAGDRGVILQLARRELEAGLPEVPLGIRERLVQLRVRQGAQLVDVDHALSSSFTMKRVATGSLWPARRIASTADSRSTPAISKRIRPGRTTATQWSGAPLPDPMRVSAGFLVAGLSGKIRIQILPPRLTERVMARRAASIWRLVIQAGSRVIRPNSPKETAVPPLDMPAMRPRMTFRCLTRRGISMASCPLGRDGRDRRGGDRPGDALVRNIAPVDPDLHADGAVRGARQDVAVADVRAERAERDATFAVPFAAGHLGAAEAAGDGDLHALGARLHGSLDRLLHGLAERDPAAQLLGDVGGHEVGVELRLADLLDLQLHLAGLREVADLLAQDLDVRSALADHDPRLGRVDRHRHVVDAALDLNATDAGIGQAALDELPHREVLLEEHRVVLVGVPLRRPGAARPEAEAVRVDLVSHVRPPALRGRW